MSFITFSKRALARRFPRAYGILIDLRARAMSRKRTFARFYRENLWKEPQSRSGTGSTLAQTRLIREAMPELLKEMQVRSLLDAPCGDLNWMRHVELGDVRYTGADIVPELVRRNERELGGPARSFIVLDIVKQPAPKVDLIFCRDCLVHLSFEDAKQALRQFKAGGSRLLLTTTFVGRETNVDIRTGAWRPINLQWPPFSLPPPLRLIDEGCTEGEGAYADKRLGLWRLEDVEIEPSA